MSRCTLKPLLIAGAVLVAGPLASLPFASPSGAWGDYNIGVEVVDFSDAPDQCLPDPDLPCTPGAGEGESHTLAVTQALVDGHLAFSGTTSSSLWDDHIWFGAEIGAACRPGFKLFRAEVNTSPGQAEGLWSDVDEVDGWTGQQISVPNARTMPVKRVAIDVPITPDLEASVFAAGEAVIQERIDEGMTDAEARALPFELVRPQSLHAEVVCRGNVGLHVKYVKSATVVVPLTVSYLAVQGAPTPPPPPPAGTRVPAGGGLAVTPQVTAAALSVVADPADPCRLHLSGSISTNAPVAVEYRFIDPHGRRTRTWTVEVDQTRVAFVHRQAAVPAGPGAPSGLVAGGVHAPLDDLVGEVDESHYTGTYLLEVVTPNHKTAADGFRVPYC